jgi:hypothetical protein
MIWLEIKSQFVTNMMKPLAGLFQKLSFSGQKDGTITRSNFGDLHGLLPDAGNKFRVLQALGAYPLIIQCKGIK